MSLSNIRIALMTLAWGLIFFATLSIAQLPGDWGHSVCGPWGCGPPLQALLACHLSWLVVLAPLALLPRYWLSGAHVLLLGSIVVASGIVGVGSVIAYELCTWLPTVSEMRRQYIFQRLGFSIVTHIDLPLIESILAGMVLISFPLKPRRFPAENNSPNQNGASNPACASIN